MAPATTSRREDPSNDRAKARIFHHSAYSTERIAAARAEQGLSVSVCLPARECAATVGEIVGALGELQLAGALDRIVVVDAASQDGTADVAAAAGAEVWQEAELMPSYGPVLGKGDAMWRATSALDGELVCFLDADSERFSAHFATGLLGPLVCEPGVSFVKAFYRRPLAPNGAGAAPSDAGPMPSDAGAAPSDAGAAPSDAGAAPGDGPTAAAWAEGGGRVNHLTARPALALFYPQLAQVRQPLAGEVAARRELLERLPFATGYGVEIAMLIDVWREVGLEGIAQVDLEEHHNRHQPLSALTPMALTVLATVARRVEREGRLTSASASQADAPDPVALHAPPERPPLASLSDRSKIDPRTSDASGSRA
jgi:glucosyl-3-phosphoglycerate synthase